MEEDATSIVKYNLYFMYVPNYDITLGKLSLMIYSLASESGDARMRLFNTMVECSPLFAEDFPPELGKEWDEFYTKITDYEGENNRLNRSIFNKRNTTCIKLIKKLINIHIELKSHKEQYAYYYNQFNK